MRRAPTPGQTIRGILTRGRGISIHRPDCHNISELVVSEGRLLDAEWTGGQVAGRPVTLALRAALPGGELAALIAEIQREMGVIIHPGRTPSKKGVRIQHWAVTADDPNKIEAVLSRLNNAEGILAVRVLESA
ncbi:MAG: hypothetical protein V3S29_07595 [bacterium]